MNQGNPAERKSTRELLREDLLCLLETARKNKAVLEEVRDRIFGVRPKESRAEAEKSQVATPPAFGMVDILWPSLNELQSLINDAGEILIDIENRL